MPDLEGDCNGYGSSGEWISFLGDIVLRRCVSMFGDGGPSRGRERIASTGTSMIVSLCGGSGKTDSSSLELTGRSLRLTGKGEGTVESAEPRIKELGREMLQEGGNSNLAQKHTVPNTRLLRRDQALMDFAVVNGRSDRGLPLRRSPNRSRHCRC